MPRKSVYLENGIIVGAANYVLHALLKGKITQINFTNT